MVSDEKVLNNSRISQNSLEQENLVLGRSIMDMIAKNENNGIDFKSSLNVSMD